ncbi:HAD family hydrolase [Xylophilus ampelinus]|uniref:HAD superfamily hydrolase (TIGR01509 family) n=1 Tax=Xylophilus ampelinus TaxID=54067 RepID=A0A318SJD2_9BURK|nr:HAD family phosphatase [Xylophilus ampelinus]MCS4510934.1 HAD family phosphatase [Xylophilus ampelinus]PYE76094.1 HAD superfamily hydrolase (TIGR01509 family) [Xylophilus ampelinus]
MPRFDAVLFDCDGVLVDSEPITHRVLRDRLALRGWVMTAEECMRIFVGKAVKDERAMMEARTGQPLTDAWLHAFWEERNLALRRDLEAVPGAPDAVRAIHAAYGGRIACASGADRQKVVLQLEKTGLVAWFDGRIFSGHETPRSKPFPDVYLAAAAALDVDPARCAVVEDSVTGATAGLAAGATVFGYCPGGPGHGSAREMQAIGVRTLFHSMDALPALLG